MARRGRTSAVRTTESGDRPQDDTGEPMSSRTEPEATGEGDIQEEIQRLENEKLQLLEQQKLRLLREEVEVLRRRQRGEATSTPVPDPSLQPQTIPSEYSGGSQTHPSLKRRATDTLGAPSKRAVKIEKIAPYYGKTIREHQDFRDSLKLAFRLEHDGFADEDTKVAFTMQYVKGTNRTLWLQYEDDHPDTQFTWEELMEFLLNQIKSPINRELHVALTYARALQRTDQPVNEFAAYLASLEAQINPPYDAKHLMIHLFAKLRPELRVAITNYQEFPQTRDQLVSLAALLEENQKSASAPQARSNRRAANSNTKTTQSDNSGKANSKTTAGDSTAGRSNTAGGSTQPQGNCSKCGQPGHWWRQCKELKRNQPPPSSVNATSTPGKDKRPRTPSQPQGASSH
jgi:DNA-directed RNA polymerase subunit M/transcription elongation factor TFIIS